MFAAICRALVTMVVVMAVKSSTFAAEVKVESIAVSPEYGKQCLVARLALKGEITLGDSARLAAAIAEVDEAAAARKSSCFVNDGSAYRLIIVDLQSVGGLYIEGWKIAKLFSAATTVAATYVSKDSFCFSACAIAFLGGSVPAAEDAVVSRRIIHPTAKVGFHAPFPALREKAYSAEDVKLFFLAAFSVVSEFIKDAKSLGITPETAQLLLQPTPDRFYEINTTGRALMTGISVSAAPVTFSVYDKGVSAITAQNAANVCYNNYILNAHGDATTLIGFLADMRRNKMPPVIAVKTKTRYFSPIELPAEALIVPVATMAEGETLSCVTVVASLPDSAREERMKIACLGFEEGDKAIANKITKAGVLGGFGGTCLQSSKLAMVPWNTKLTEIPAAYMGN